MTIAEENLQKAEVFLKENQAKKEIVSENEGKLQYQILEEGKGDDVKDNATPLLEYKGSFIDGKVFDSSERSGGPVSIPIAQTIPGFKNGIIGMKEGEKRRIFIHPELGYATTGPLPPNSLLIFEVKVIKA